MKIQQAYKFKLRPSQQAEAKLFRMIGSCRFVWNKLLALNLARLKRGQRTLHWVEMSRLLPLMKRIWPWLASDPYAQGLQQVCRRLFNAFSRMFRKLGRKPRFKRRNQICSARFPSALRVEGNHIKIPKIGWMRFFHSREIEGKIKNVTITKKSTGWFMSVQTERQIVDPVHPSNSEIGIDVGITRFATFSDGSFIAPVNAMRTLEKRLAKAQRLLSRKKRFSNNYRKQKKQVSRIHSKIANMRKDFLHKHSTAISESQATVYVEDLKVKNMSASAAGSVENPGCNVTAKSRLNKSILDQGWATFRRFLGYKLAWRGGQLVAVPPKFTSQRCPKCDHVAKENRKSQSKFECVLCGYTENADVVGATNILRAGQALCGAGELSLA